MTVLFTNCLVETQVCITLGKNWDRVNHFSHQTLAGISGSPAYEISDGRLFPVLFFHFYLHFGHWFGHGEGHFGFGLQFLLPCEEIHVIQGFRFFFRSVSIRIGRTLFALWREKEQPWAFCVRRHLWRWATPVSGPAQSGWETVLHQHDSLLDLVYTNLK